MVQYQEQCNRITVEECYDAEEWVCEEEVEPDNSYGAPRVCFENLIFKYPLDLIISGPGHLPATGKFMFNIEYDSGQILKIFKTL